MAEEKGHAFCHTALRASRRGMLSDNNESLTPSLHYLSQFHVNGTSSSRRMGPVYQVN